MNLKVVCKRNHENGHVYHGRKRGWGRRATTDLIDEVSSNGLSLGKVPMVLWSCNIPIEKIDLWFNILQ